MSRARSGLLDFYQVTNFRVKMKGRLNIIDKYSCMKCGSCNIYVFHCCGVQNLVFFYIHNFWNVPIHICTMIKNFSRNDLNYVRLHQMVPAKKNIFGFFLNFGFYQFALSPKITPISVLLNFI